MSHFRKRFGFGVSGALLLSGLQLTAPVCLAQSAPAVAAPTKATNAMQMLARRQAIEEQIKRCAQPIDVKVSGATLKQLVRQVQLAMPDTSIELRLSAEDKALQREVDENKVKLDESKLPQFSFELEQKPLGDILQSAATLAGYEFFVMPDELLICQPKQLAPGEREHSATWDPVQARFAASSLNTHRTFAKPLTKAQQQVIQANNENLLLIGRQLLALAHQQGATEAPFTMRFGDLSPELQQRIQTSADYLSRSSKYPSIKVPFDAAIDLTNFDTSNVRFSLTIKATNPVTDLNHVYGFGTDVSSGANTSGPTYFLPLQPTSQSPVEKP